MFDYDASRRPIVSVIVPVFNEEKYIGRCLRSLLHQSLMHSDYEIIVVNDGSTDNTSYAVSLFCDPSEGVVRYLEKPTNDGLPAALNLAIKEAKSDLIVRVDADDFVNKNFLNFLCYFLKQNTHYDAVACDYLLVDDEETVIERMNCSDNPIGCGILFQKHQLLDVGLYDEEFLWQEEKDLRIRFLEKYRISRLELPLYRYRRHEANITNNVNKMEQYQTLLLKKHKQ